MSQWKDIVREEERAIGVITLSEAGHSQRQVAQQLGVNQSTVSRILRWFRETGSNRRRHGQGLPTVTSERHDGFLLLAVLRDRFQTSVQLQHLSLIHISEPTRLL